MFLLVIFDLGSVTASLLLDSLSVVLDWFTADLVKSP